jgi:hypothetical protein
MTAPNLGLSQLSDSSLSQPARHSAEYQSRGNAAHLLLILLGPDQTMVAPVEKEIDWFRGPRDHLLATDVLSIAPFSADQRSFEFRFRKPARHPGRWAREDQTIDCSAHIEPVAKLQLQFADRRENWVFVTDTSRSVEKRVSDLDEVSMCRTLTVRHDESELIMSDRFSVWEYIVASGRRLFPETKWHFAYLIARWDPSLDRVDGKRLRLKLKHDRSKFVEFEFFVSDVYAGLFGAFRRP